MFPARQAGYWRKLATALAGMAVALAAPALAWAQGCPLCYTAAAATKAGGIQALRSGILILMIPPVLIFGAVSLVAIRRRNLFCEGPETDLGGDVATLEDDEE